MTEATYRIPVVLPEITPEKLAKLRCTRPLANLGPSTGRATPRADVRPPSDRPREWWCWAPGPVNGRLKVFVATYFYEARKKAAIEFQCSPGQIRIWEWL